MTDLLKRAYDPEEFRRMGHQLVDILADHLGRCLTQEEPLVLPWQPPQERYQFWLGELESSELGEEDFWKQTIQETIHIQHPNYFGHQVWAALPMAGLGDLVNGVLNNGSAIYEMGPVSTAMEHAVIQWLAQAIGMGEKADGFLTSGGSLGNFTALLSARQAKSGYDHWKEGLKPGHKPAVMVSEQAHYSVSRSVQMLGWGAEAVIKLPTDEQFAVDANRLEEIYQEKTAAGFDILIMVANACSTGTGSYDPLEAIADFCEKYQIWMHVDGAHGGAAALSPKYSHLTRGMERADSIVIDFHKMMGVSALTTAVMFKNPEPSYQTFEQKASYILNQGHDPEWYNSAKRTVECTKNMMGVKVYAILQTYGPQIFIDYLETCYDLGRQFAELINRHPHFELAHMPETNIVVFRFIDHEKTEVLNKINKAIRKATVEEGIFYIVQTEIDGIAYLRTVLMNPFTTTDEMKKLLNYLSELSNTIKR